jgi:hypothetical protein
MTTEVLTFEDGGSGTGVSYYTRGALCPRRINLEADNSALAGMRANAGTVFHKLCELYHGEITDVTIDVSAGQEEALKEGRRMFDAYTKWFTPGWWGKVVERFGVPFTCRIDMVVRVSDGHCEYLEKHGLRGITPGLYLVDHKTAGSKDNHAQLKYQSSIQFRAYMLAWDLLEDELCSGMIVNNVVGHKEMRIKDAGPRKPKSRPVSCTTSHARF